MTIRSSRPSLVVRALVACTLAVPALAAAGAAAPAAAATPLDGVACAATSVLRAPAPLADALGAGLSDALVRLQNDLTHDEVEHLAEDATTWVDPCGRVFVVDEAAPPAQQSSVAEAPAGGVPADVFALSSRPGADRTIYLDFDGATYSGTRWRNGETIVSPAFSVDSDPTTFSDVERTQIYLAWQVVAEDFAPFDVNVTTRTPAPSALTRTSASDPTFGMPVVVTATNSVGADCGCGGMAYVGVLGNAAANDHQPAWVFTQGSGTNGYNVGQAISHEVGHTFGLSHDGADGSSYYAGAQGWAPIMGASYNRRASQWSRGEYPGATNTEDDVAIIARTAPVVADDHADGAARATRTDIGSNVAGVIGTRSDVDAFTFTVGGPTTLAVAGPPGRSNLDVRLTVLDAQGRTVAVVDPVADSASDDSMAAVWSADLPAPATYTALVDGVGNGDPAVAGRYSDYGSLGAYTVSLTAGLVAPSSPPPVAPVTSGTTAGSGTATTTPSSATPDHARDGMDRPSHAGIGFVTRTLPAARVGRRYRAEIRFSGSASEARVDWRLPIGLSWRVVGDRIVLTGRPKARTSSRFTAEVSGADGTVRRKYRIVVR